MSGKFNYMGLSRIYNKSSDSSSVLKTLGPALTVVILTLHPRTQICEKGREREHEIKHECERMCKNVCMMAWEELRIQSQGTRV